MKEITKPLKKSNKEKCYTFLEPELKQQLEKMAQADDRNLSAMIRILIRKALGLSE